MQRYEDCTTYINSINDIIQLISINIIMLLVLIIQLYIVLCFKLLYRTRPVNK